MRAALPPDWSGRTVVCLASGPSLCAEDVEAVRGMPTIVTNTTFRAAPWADVLYGFDLRWWRAHIEEVRATFSGRKICRAPDAHREFPDVESTSSKTWYTIYSNSGACAISIAIAARARRVILLGYDCSKSPEGRWHWHGDHPKTMSNCASIANWPHHFKQVARHALDSGVEVINCSRRTALDCFERKPLSEIACEASELARA